MRERAFRWSIFFLCVALLSSAPRAAEEVAKAPNTAAPAATENLESPTDACATSGKG